MQSQTELMELRELMDEVLNVYVEREVTWLEVHQTLIQSQPWSHRWEAMQGMIKGEMIR